MATREYWEAKDDLEFWQKTIGHDDENPQETMDQADVIFDGMIGAQCLEIGAGFGRLLRAASARFVSVIGVDYSRAMVNRSAMYLLFHPRCRIVLGDGLIVPFADESFDFVYSFTCFQHMPDFVTILWNLTEVFRVLRRDGVCRIQTVRGDRASGRHDGYVFSSVDEFWELFERTGFAKVSAEVVDEWIWITARKP